MKNQVSAITKRDALILLVGTLLGEKAMNILANILALIG